MIEEFMLLANCAVAQRILDAYPGLALLRRHPTPTPAMVRLGFKLSPLVSVGLQLKTRLGSVRHPGRLPRPRPPAPPPDAHARHGE